MFHINITHLLFVFTYTIQSFLKLLRPGQLNISSSNTDQEHY